jgi:hypothetical protein
LSVQGLSFLGKAFHFLSAGAAFMPWLRPVSGTEPLRRFGVA